jgi:hypothetical protein
LDPVQLQAAGVIVDLVAKQFRSRTGEYGGQEMIVKGTSLPFEFDGQQLYIVHRIPTKLKLDTMPFVEITSNDHGIYPLPATKRKSAFRRLVQVVRRHQFTKEALDKWKAQLCYIPDAVVLKTLAATSQLIESVEVENRLVPRKHLVGRL